MMKFLKLLATELFISESVKKTMILHELQEANKKSNKK
jgi:hypothetical protein